MINWRLVPVGTLLKDNRVFLEFNEIDKTIKFRDIKSDTIKTEHVESNRDFEIADCDFKLKYLLKGSCIKINDRLFYYNGLREDEKTFYYSEQRKDKWITMEDSVEKFKTEYLKSERIEDFHSAYPFPIKHDKPERELENGSYYYITLFKQIYHVYDDRSTWDDRMYRRGNYFSTYEDAKKEVDILFKDEISKPEKKKSKNIIVNLLEKELSSIENDLSFLNNLYDIDTKKASKELIKNIFARVDEEYNRLVDYKKEIEKLLKKEYK